MSKPYTVTMTGTYFVMAENEDDAMGIIYKAILHTPMLDERVEDAECHWAKSVTIEGHYSTIIRDDDEISDYDAQIQYLTWLKTTAGENQ